MRTALACLFVAAAVLTVGAKEEPVDVRVSSPFAVAPADVMVTARIVPDRRNRALIISAESPDYLRRSTIELDGEQEARVHQMWLNSLPEGEYIVSARVLGADGLRAHADVKLRVNPGRRRGDAREP
ncbi:MAG TPA: hypothetical protein VH740_19950 [Vicinamibacterales bacterium]|jgi:hypothetical protein